MPGRRAERSRVERGDGDLICNVVKLSPLAMKPWSWDTLTDPGRLFSTWHMHQLSYYSIAAIRPHPPFAIASTEALSHTYEISANYRKAIANRSADYTHRPKAV